MCGFIWDDWSIPAVITGLANVAQQLVAELQQAPVTANQRPTAEVWSIVEYGCHIRDVLYMLRDRITLALAEDTPTPKLAYFDVRVASGFYAQDTPEILAQELPLAAGLFSRTLAALSPAQLARSIVHTWPQVTERQVSWIAAQALHECEHHLADIKAQRLAN